MYIVGCIIQQSFRWLCNSPPALHTYIGRKYYRHNWIKLKFSGWPTFCVFVLCFTKPKTYFSELEHEMFVKTLVEGYNINGVEWLGCTRLLLLNTIDVSEQESIVFSWNFWVDFGSLTFGLKTGSGKLGVARAGKLGIVSTDKLMLAVVQTNYR